MTVGHGRASGIAVEDAVALVFTFATASAACGEQAFRNQDEALEAAGLSE